ncbi:MAG: hypothetical protein ACYDB2_12270 [Acidimicrobiales bacterium]
MSDVDGTHVDGALEVAQQKVDPFTKIRFQPRVGLMALAPIRLGVFKEIPDVAPDATDAKRGDR